MNRLENLLIQTGYPDRERNFIVNGFRHGFRIGYKGPTNVKLTAPNLKLEKPEHQVILWNKVMKEVKLKCFAGPFEDIPFKETHYIQSPIWLVPKDNGSDMRLIFHLSYPRGTGRSVNANTPAELCSVKYPDFNEVIKICLAEGKNCKISRSDMKAAFRNLGISKRDFWLLIIKAKCPLNNKTYYLLIKHYPLGVLFRAATSSVFQTASHTS